MRRTAKKTDYRSEYAGKTPAELKKLKTRLLIEISETMGIFSVRRKKELEQRLDAVEQLMDESDETGAAQ